MTRILALLWLAVVLLAAGYLSVRVHAGLSFRTDLMALLPQDQQNPDTQRAKDAAMKALSRHFVLMIGDHERDAARTAAINITKELAASGEVELSATAFNQDSLKRMGTFYFPYREGLLSRADRQLLLDNKGPQAARQALSKAYGMMGFASADMLRRDPFLLAADFFAGLPVPVSHLTLDDGLLTAQEDGITWIMIAGQIRSDPFALATQKAVAGLVDQSIGAQRINYPNLQALRLGAIFFAQAGAQQAMRETSLIGVASFVGTILLVLITFRSMGPLFLSLLAIAVGILLAFSGSILVFGEMHVGALLFGTSLIGVAVDYSLQYCCEIFAPKPGTPAERLRRVIMAITLGASTVVIGYLTFLLAPFPGLHQIAVFSVIGLIGAWLTVVAWFPVLDRTRQARYGQSLLSTASHVLDLWENCRKRRLFYAVLGVVAVGSIIGLEQFRYDDDVRHMQSLNPTLLAQQNRITGLIGKSDASRLFVVQADSDEHALQIEEQLVERLQPLVTQGDLSGFEALAQFVPSAARQTENRTLVRGQLYEPLLSQQIRQLKLTDAPQLPDKNQPPLTLDAMRKDGAEFPFVKLLDIGDDIMTMHIVMLDGIKNEAAVAAAAQGLNGVSFVDPAGDFSYLLGVYRTRALGLLGLSALLMLPLLIGRYGLSKGLWIMLPPALAVMLTPGLRSLAGGSFTFFDAMALVLILSIGIDYSIFLAETSNERKHVTMLAVALAACTALMSFGLLALSHVSAVHNFGATMLTGITIAFLLAPMARFPAIKISKPLMALLLLAGLSGCAGETGTVNAPGSVDIATGVNMALPKPAELGRKIEASQLVTGTYGDCTFVFQVRVSADKDHFRVAGLDMMGRRSIGIDWTANGITYQSAPWVPSQLRPENILADMILLYWPEKVVQRSLQNSGTLMVGRHSRVIMKDRAKVFEVTYSGNDKWVGRLRYSNLERGYSLDVQSAIVTP